MVEGGPLINRVAQSGLITIDLQQWVEESSIASFDLKPFLFREMILKEKDYRDALKNFDWSSYENKNVAVHCSADAIIPRWAYMLAASYLIGIANTIHFGNEAEVYEAIILKHIDSLNVEEYVDQSIVVKGCGDNRITEKAYLNICTKLQSVVKSLMYGEACSTVPIYKAVKKDRTS